MLFRSRPVVTPPAPTPAPKQLGSAKPAAPAPPEARPATKPEPTRAQAVEVPPPQRASTAPARGAVAVENGTRAQRPQSPPPAAPASGDRAAEPVGGDSTDGSAAVDWFLKGRK